MQLEGQASVGDGDWTAFISVVCLFCGAGWSCLKDFCLASCPFSGLLFEGLFWSTSVRVSRLPASPSLSLECTVEQNSIFIIVATLLATFRVIYDLLESKVI